MGFVHLLTSMGKAKHIEKLEDFFNLFLLPGGGEPITVTRTDGGAAGAGLSLTASGLESTLLYLKAAQEALGSNLKELASMLKRSSEVTDSLSGAFEQVKTLTDRTNELLENIDRHQGAHREALQAIAAEARKGNEQSLSHLERTRRMDEQTGNLLKNLEAERRAFREHMNEHTAEVRREIEILNKTVTSAILEMGKTAERLLETTASRRSTTGGGEA
jgi:ABC-type transporter Mla subunit MlaD